MGGGGGGGGGDAGGGQSAADTLVGHGTQPGAPRQQLVLAHESVADVADASSSSSVHELNAADALNGAMAEMAAGGPRMLTITGARRVWV